MIAILSIFSFSISQHVRQKITLADRIDTRNFLNNVSEMGVYQTLYKIRERKEAAEGSYALNDTYTSGQKSFANIPVGGDGLYTVSYEIQGAEGQPSRTHFGVEDEEGKINVNVLDAKTLAKFFEIVGDIDQDLAEELGYAIVDWRDSDNSLSHPEYGGEDDYYEDLEIPYEAKDYSFESLDELLLVRGMTPELFERFKPFVTIYGVGAININTAPREVLAGLGMEESLIDAIMTFRFGPDREDGTSDDGVFMDTEAISANLISKVKAPQSGVNFLNQLIAAGRFGVNSVNFRIRSHGMILSKKQILDIEAVADGEGKILSWSTGLPRRMSPAELERATAITKKRDEDQT